MNKKSLIAFVLMLVTSLGFSKTIAEVDGKKIDSSEVDAQIKLIIKNSGGKIKDTKELKNDVLQRLISREIILKEAKKLGLDKNKEYLEAVKVAEEEAKRKGVDHDVSFKKDFEAYKAVLLADTYAMNFLKKNQISDKEAKIAYNSMVKFYQGSEEIRVGEILVKTQSDALKVISELKKGVSFETVAKKYTIDTKLKAYSGIYKDYVNLKDLRVGAPDYYVLVKDLKKGQYTQNPINSENNYLIVKIIDKRPVKIPNFNKIKNTIKIGIAQDKLHQESQRLSKVYKVKIY